MAETIRFGVYELDQEAMELRKDGSPIRLQEQPFKVLALLADRPGKIVTREELREQIWGNTFVDFDQSLNKAINRVREALNDNAATPEYVETVPRRGYRFIAPVIASPANGMSIPAAFATTDTITTSEKQTRRSWIVPVAAIVVVGLLAILGVATALRWRQPRSPTLPEARLITSFGWQPTLSRDGKLLAYVSSVGDEPSHIWVQQTAAGEAIQVTAGPEFDDLPDFSPDGTRIAFYSARGGGGIYTTSTLPGEPRLLVGSPKAIFPRFSPDADRILYLQGHAAFTVSVNGGQPAPLPFNGDFTLYSPALWSPGGKEILFFASLRREPNQRPSWWIAPVAAGQARMVHLPGLESGRPVGGSSVRLGSGSGRPRMDPLLHHQTSQLETLPHPRFCAGHDRRGSRNYFFRERQSRLARGCVAGWQTGLHNRERQRIDLPNFHQRSGPEIGTHPAVTSSRG